MGEASFWLMALAAGLSLSLLIAMSIRPAAKLPLDEWRCSATHTEQRPISTTNGPTMETVYACDQWSRR